MSDSEVSDIEADSPQQQAEETLVKLQRELGQRFGTIDQKRVKELGGYIMVVKNEDEIIKKAGESMTGSATSERIKQRLFSERRRNAISRIIRTGIEIRYVDGVDSREGNCYLYLTASDSVLRTHAEHTQLEVKLLDGFGGGYAPFLCEKEEMFERSGEKIKGWKKVGLEYKKRLFSASQRMHLTYSLLHSRKHLGGADLHISKLVNDGILAAFFPIHEHEARDWLVDNWVKKPWRSQPLDYIRWYFGEKLALYFAFIGYYNLWLFGASVAGIIATPIALLPQVQFDIPLTVFSVFIALWSAVFLEFWKRNNAVLAWKWNMANFEEEEEVRPGFEGEERLGVWYQGAWVSLKQFQDEHDTTFSQKYSLHYGLADRRNKLFVAWPTLGFIFLCIVAAAVGLIAFKAFVENESWGPIVGGIANGVIIVVLESVYKWIATKMNNWENYRTETQYEDQLIYKLFLVQFVNAYIALFYIAFVKGRVGTQKCVGFSTLDKNITIFNATTNSTMSIPNPATGNCLEDLFVGLATILATRIATSQLTKLIMPLVISWARQAWARCRRKTKRDLSFVQKQARLGDYEGVLSLYNDLAIQFGYVTMFAAAFPLAPVAAFINNIIEMRTDGYAFLKAFKRPNYQGARDIGTWYKIMEFMSYAAVLTNVCIIAFTPREAGIFRPKDDERSFSRDAVLLALFLENAILFLKYFLSQVIPDVPVTVRRKMSKQSYFRDQALLYALTSDDDAEEKKRKKEARQKKKELKRQAKADKKAHKAKYKKDKKHKHKRKDDSSGSDSDKEEDEDTRREKLIDLSDEREGDSEDSSDDETIVDTIHDDGDEGDSSEEEVDTDEEEGETGTESDYEVREPKKEK